MSKKTVVLLLILIVSLFVFVGVFFFTRQEEDTPDIQSIEREAKDISGQNEVDLDKFFDFDNQSFGDTKDDQTFTSESNLSEDKECTLNGQTVKVGTVASNTTCVSE